MAVEEAGVLVLVAFLRSSADATTYLVLGILDAQKQDFDGAIADATRAIEIDPKLVEGYVLRGAAKSDKGDLDGAISDPASRSRSIRGRGPLALC